MEKQILEKTPDLVVMDPVSGLSTKLLAAWNDTPLIRLQTVSRMNRPLRWARLRLPKVQFPRSRIPLDRAQKSEIQLPIPRDQFGDEFSSLKTIMSRLEAGGVANIEPSISIDPIWRWLQELKVNT
jgi:hypothetical protein